MAMVSKKVKVFGVPGFEAIGYEDWHRQCEHEFRQGSLRRIAFEDLQTKMETESLVAFEAVEIVEGRDGSVNRNRVEIFLKEEGDGQWRLVQEKILESKPIDIDLGWNGAPGFAKIRPDHLLIRSPALAFGWLHGACFASARGGQGGASR
jgi:hypothetical protein